MKNTLNVVHTKSEKIKFLHPLVYLFFFVVFVVVCILESKRWDKYIAKTVEIRQEDSVSTEIINIWIVGGYAYFNDSLKIRDYKVNRPNLGFRDIQELEVPFYLKKEANNDTIWIIDNKETYFWVLIHDRE